MKRLLLGVAAILFVCLTACPIPVPVTDAGPDGGVDAGRRPIARPIPDASIEHLPSVTPSGKTCSAGGMDGAICVAEGWFQLSQWSTQVLRANDGGWLEGPRQSVYLDRFYLDATEVTNESYERYLEDAGALPPPALCGCTNEDFPEDFGWQTVSETSGWTDAGRPEAGRARQPVVCVTRSEAMAYCAWRGGRLPSVAEFLKAARGGFPSVRRTPWGDEPPSLDDNPLTTLPFNFFTAYLAANLRAPAVDGLGMQNAPEVATRRLGLSATGAFDLTGSASEFASECLEQLAPVYGSDPQRLSGELSPLVRPDAGAPLAQCAVHFLVVGDNWFSSLVDRNAQGSMQVYSRAGGHLTNVGDRNGGAGDVFGNPICPEPDGDPGNSRRSWSIGFRCAYDSRP